MEKRKVFSYYYLLPLLLLLAGVLLASCGGDGNVSVMPLGGETAGGEPGDDLPEIIVQRDPWDRFYDERLLEVISQYEYWKEDFGGETAIQMTLDWLNNKELPGIDVPPIPEEVVMANPGAYDNQRIFIRFADGNEMYIKLPSDYSDDMSESGDFQESEQFVEILKYKRPLSSKAVIPTTTNVLILAPLVYVEQATIPYSFFVSNPPLLTYDPAEGTFNKSRVYGDIADELIEAGYNVTRIITKLEDIRFDPNGVYTDPNLNIPLPFWPERYIIPAYMKSGHEENIVKPWDFENLDKYSVIYIKTHGPELLTCSFFDPNDNELKEWMKSEEHPRYDSIEKTGDWELGIHNNSLDTGPAKGYYIKCIAINPESLIKKQNFSISKPIIYMDVCKSWNIKHVFFTDPL